LVGQPFGGRRRGHAHPGHDRERKRGDGSDHETSCDPCAPQAWKPLTGRALALRRSAKVIPSTERGGVWAAGGDRTKRDPPSADARPRTRCASPPALVKVARVTRPTGGVRPTRLDKPFAHAPCVLFEKDLRSLSCAWRSAVGSARSPLRPLVLTP
jgi:hypothetical protein